VKKILASLKKNSCKSEKILACEQKFSRVWKILSSLNKNFHESEKNSRESEKNSRESEKILARLKKFSPVWEKVSRVEKNSCESKKFAQIEKIQNFLWVEKIQASQKIVKINKTPPWFLHPPK
jgi:uncharacterized protein YcbK (DUF882 family)